jgi:protein ImuB
MDFRYKENYCVPGWSENRLARSRLRSQQNCERDELRQLMPAFACIFVPDFSVEALLRAAPELRSQSVVVLEGKAPLQKVFAVNENARHAGVEPGMTRLQLEACSGLMLCDRSPLQEITAHAALLDCAQSFSPRVEDARCDTILLDLAGLEPLFGPLLRIARAMARRASDLGLEVHVAIASNPDTAALAARGFRGVTVIPAGKEAEQLGSLPVEILWESLSESDSPQEAEQFLETLTRWGVRNLRALAALPDVAISERLGQKGIRLQQLARGATSRTLVPVEPPLLFEEAIELEYPLVLLEPLAFLLGRLLEQLCARLGARTLATQELRLRLELEHGCYAEEIAEPATSHVGTGVPARPGRTQARQPCCENGSRKIFQRTLRLPVPLLDAKTFLKLLQLDLKAHPPGAPIVKIHLSAEPVRPRAAQGSLFLPPSPEPEKLDLTLARIAGIVGENRAGSLELLDTHRPEGFRMQRFVPGMPQEKDKPDNNTEKAHAITALRIFRPPVHAAVTLRDGAPSRLACSGRRPIQGEVLWAAGPWRSSGDWWEQEGWARDEWDIALQAETGIALYRLVRDLLSGRWYVEGSYD